MYAGTTKNVMYVVDVNLYAVLRSVLCALTLPQAKIAIALTPSQNMSDRVIRVN